MRPTTCPDEIELMPLVAGETPKADLDEHLKSCDSCRGRLKKLKARIETLRVAAGELAASPGQSNQSRDPEIPKQIGQYDIVETLDTGGQAQVLRAFHRALRQEVVIKLGLDPVPADEADADGLVNEARLLRTLDHPHLAKVYDLDFHEHRPVLVMEFIRGRSLYQLGKERVFTPGDAANLIAKVSRAAGAAHRIGVYHRDITPRNILVDEDEQPRLIDFGLVCLRSAWGERHEPLGLVAGTRIFMSPEQASGHSAQVDSRSDIYGLGQVLKYILADRSDPLSEQLKLRADVPARLAMVIERATATEPANRFSSAEDFAAALERSVKPRWPREWVALAALLMIAAMVGGGFALWPKPKLKPISMAQDILYPSDRRSLADVLPLGPIINDVSVLAEVPRGWSPLLLFIDPDGKVAPYRKLALAAGSSRPEMDKYQCWIEGWAIGKGNPKDHFTPDPRGVKLILIVAAPDSINDQQVDLIAQKVKAALAGIWSPPDDGVHSAFSISGQGVTLVGIKRGFELVPLPPAELQVQTQLESIRKRLDEFGIEFYAGVSFPYDPTPPTTHKASAP